MRRELDASRLGPSELEFDAQIEFTNPLRDPEETVRSASSSGSLLTRGPFAREATAAPTASHALYLRLRRDFA